MLRRWDRDAEQREIEALKQLVSRYCNHVDKLRRAPYEVNLWDETLTVDHRGDTHSNVLVSLRVRQADLLFVRLKFACGWPQPARYRNQVRTTVRSLLPGGSPGTKLYTTSYWVTEDTTDVIVHFPSPQKAASEVSFVVDQHWPRRSAPLLAMEPDEFTVLSRHPTAHVRYRVVLPPGTSAYVEPIGSPDAFAEFQVKAAEDGSDRETVHFELFGLPARQRIGARLELKAPGRA